MGEEEKADKSKDKKAGEEKSEKSKDEEARTMCMMGKMRIHRRIFKDTLTKTAAEMCMKAGMMGGRIIRMTTSTRMTMRTITRMITTMSTTMMKISTMTIMTVTTIELSMLSPVQICPLYPVATLYLLFFNLVPFLPFDVLRYSCQRRV